MFLKKLCFQIEVFNFNYAASFFLLLLKAFIVTLEFKLLFPYFSPSGFFSGYLDFFFFLLLINMNLVKYI